MADSVTTTLVGELPGGLLDAFDAYERALAANDQEALALAFEAGADALRADASGLLVGHDAITSFRGRRASAPQREVVERHVRVLSPTLAVIVSVNAPTRGGRGIVTQVWRRAADGAGDAGRGGSSNDDAGGSAFAWRILSAQVQAPAAPLDGSIWRVAGAPLVASHLTPDLDGADSAEPSAPLAGETVAVKDLFAVRGFAIGAGVPAFLAEAPLESLHSPAVQALLDAGAVVAGIAQTDEFAFSIAGRNAHYGTPPNAAAPGAISGGSSSGPASAVALGQASIGLGTDTGGSIRVPASYQGLWGLRTTHGAVSNTGVLALAPSFDTVGWLTRDPALLGRVAATSLVGPSGHGPFSGSGQRDVAEKFVIDEGLVAGATPEVRTAFDDTVAALQAADAIGPVESVAVGDIAGLFEVFRVVQSAEAWRSHGRWITDHEGELAPDVLGRFRFGASLSDEREAEARAALYNYRDALDRELGGRILLLPSTASAAPSLSASAAEIDAVRSSTLGLTCVAGIGGYPAVSAPLMRVPGGPVGLSLVGPRGADLALVRVAARLAAALSA